MQNQQTNLLYSSQGLKKTHPSDSSSKMPLWGGGGVGGHVRAHHPGHPFVQDPTMPPLSPPNTLTQLEEACRRLEEASKPNKQRYRFYRYSILTCILKEDSFHSMICKDKTQEVGLGMH